MRDMSMKRFEGSADITVVVYQRESRVCDSYCSICFIGLKRIVHLEKSCIMNSPL